MEYAAIVPQTKLHLVKGRKVQMALCHLIDKEGYEAYSEFYREQAQESYVIMDNGVIEGDQRPLVEITKKAKEYGFQEIIAPDVFLDSNATINTAVMAWEHLKDLEDLKVQWVPQGKSVDEWLYCLEQMLGNGIKPDVLGVPKILSKLDGRDARLNAVIRLDEVLPEGMNPEIHFLGCHQDPIELLRATKLSRKVRSCDSALAYVYARNSKNIIECARPDQKVIDFKDGECCDILLAKNIQFIDKQIKGKYMSNVGGVTHVQF